MFDDEESVRGGEARLWSLLQERSKPGADTAAIDRRIWDLFGEDWSVMFTDLTGFSRQVEAFGIIHFLQEIYEQRALLFPVLRAHDGVLVKAVADSYLLLFRRPESALRCAIAMQKTCQTFNAQRAPEAQVLLCIGIGHGRVLRVGASDVWGREVNAASKLGEDTAKANEILVTSAFRSALGTGEPVRFEQLGITVPGSVDNYRVLY